MKVSLDAGTETLEVETESTSARATWSNFVDYRICNTGILVYPQKNIFYRIPASAEIEALISTKITKKI